MSLIFEISLKRNNVLQITEKVQIVTICAGMLSIVFYVLVSNEFGAELDLKVFDLILLRMKITPAIVASVLFRCSSFTIMVTLLKFYSIIPVLWILWISNNTTQKIEYSNRSHIGRNQKIQFARANV